MTHGTEDTAKGFTAHPDSWAAHLDDGEKLIWTGLPIKAFRLRTHGWAFSIALTLQLAFGIFILSFISMAVMWVFTLHPLLILLVYLGPGLAVLFMMAVWRWLTRRTAHYALTDKRAIVATTFPYRRLLSYPIYADKPIFVGKTSPKSLYFAITRHQAKFATYRSFHGFDYLQDFDTALRHATSIQDDAPLRPESILKRASKWFWTSTRTNTA